MHLAGEPGALYLEPCALNLEPRTLAGGTPNGVPLCQVPESCTLYHVT